MVQGLPVVTAAAVAEALEQVNLAEHAEEARGMETASAPASPVQSERAPSPSSSIYLEARDRHDVPGPSSSMREEIGTTEAGTSTQVSTSTGERKTGSMDYEATQAGNRNAAQMDAKPLFLPAFIDVDDTPLTKQGTKTQLTSLQQFECDSEDASLTARLQRGVRPGEFCKLFERISWVDKVSSKPHCKQFIHDLGEWMRRMAEADKCQTALPECVSSLTIRG